MADAYSTKTTPSTTTQALGAAYVFTRHSGGWANKESNTELSTTTFDPGGRLIVYAVDITPSGRPTRPPRRRIP